MTNIVSACFSIGLFLTLFLNTTSARDTDTWPNNSVIPSKNSYTQNITSKFDHDSFEFFRSRSKISCTDPIFTASAFDLNFTGLYQKTHIDLSFNAASNRHNSHFVIERSFNGSAFAECARMFAEDHRTASEYELKDYVVHEDGLYTYRLYIVDKTETKHYIDEVEVHVNNDLELSSKLYPNPAVESVTLELETTKSTEIKAILVNAGGSISDTNLIDATLEIGINAFNLDISGLSPGLYTIRVQAEEKVMDKKLIVIGQ